MSNENEKDTQIVFNTYDLVIRETVDGDEYVAFDKGFNPTFLKAMRARGVEKVERRED